MLNTKELWRVEDVFGELKGALKARPVFHWKDHRITGHLTMCFIALLCEAHVTRALRRERDDYDGRAVRAKIIEPRQLSAVTVFRELAQVRAVPVSIGRQRIWSAPTSKAMPPSCSSAWAYESLQKSSRGKKM